MSKSTSRFICSAATAIGAASFLTFVGPAGAIPSVPLAPACSWKLPNFLTIHQDNNIDVRMAINDNKLAGTAEYTSPGGGVTGGSAEGALNSDGHTFLFIMRWNTGGQNNYHGSISDDGAISGNTLNEKNATNNWTASPNATCVAAPAPPAPAPVPVPAPAPVPAAAPAPAPAAAQNTATVVSDVDVYDKKNEPDGAGTIVGILHSPNTVQLLGPCKKKAWCNVSGDAVPTGSGWVWGALDF